MNTLSYDVCKLILIDFLEYDRYDNSNSICLDKLINVKFPYLKLLLHENDIRFLLTMKKNYPDFDGTTSLLEVFPVKLVHSLTYNGHRRYNYHMDLYDDSAFELPAGSVIFIVLSSNSLFKTKTPKITLNIYRENMYPIPLYPTCFEYGREENMKDINNILNYDPFVNAIHNDNAVSPDKLMEAKSVFNKNDTKTISLTEFLEHSENNIHQKVDSLFFFLLLQSMFNEIKSVLINNIHSSCLDTLNSICTILFGNLFRNEQSIENGGNPGCDVLNKQNLLYGIAFLSRREGMTNIKANFLLKHIEKIVSTTIDKHLYASIVQDNVVPYSSDAFGEDELDTFFRNPLD